MLNIQINHDGVKIESKGKMVDLLGEITYVIHNIHSSLDSHDPEMASANLIGPSSFNDYVNLFDGSSYLDLKISFIVSP